MWKSNVQFDTKDTHKSVDRSGSVGVCVRRGAVVPLECLWPPLLIHLPRPANSVCVRSDRGDSAVFVLLWQVPREDLPGVLSQELLEDGREGDHRLAGAQLGTLHHALLVIDKEVGAAGQHRPALLRARLGWALCAEVGHEPVNQLAQVPAGKRTH